MNNKAWPELPYEDFKPTAHLLHMGMQALGKLKLMTPFEPEWANVPLWLTSRGLTTGPIPYSHRTFCIDVDLIDHLITCTTSDGRTGAFDLGAMSVAQLVEMLFDTLRVIGIDASINSKPQEVPNPIPFEQDTQQRPYDSELVNAWWQILVNTHRVMQQYHGRFNGKTPPIGLMWGTLDLRDARYNGKRVATTGSNAGYIRRNAMDEAQIEVGWWSGNPSYPRPAYFSFTYPQPKRIEEAKISPKAAHWEPALGEFILDYDDVRRSNDPDNDLLQFLESTYAVGAKKAGWDSNLLGPGKPV